MTHDYFILVESIKAELTPRQNQVFELILLNYNSSQIAEAIGFRLNRTRKIVHRIRQVVDKVNK